MRSASSWSRSTGKRPGRCTSSGRTGGAASPTSAGSRCTPTSGADASPRLFQRHLIHDLGFHRVQLEIYAFNERAQRHAERAGFTREGVRRKAYWRNDEWVDGVLFGLVAEDLGRES
jgi:hypothetical protein